LRIKSAVEKHIPYLGICLGMQTLIKALGGRVVKADNKEIGFKDPAGDQYTVALTEAGRSDPLFSGLASSLPVFHLHGETVELLDNMTLLAAGQHCRNQIVKVGGNAYGVQSHFELVPDMLAEWASQDPDLIPIGKEKLLDEFAAMQTAYTTAGTLLFRNFLKIAKLL
jgi:GMP synthase (glutamine-hydrolysing)